MGHKGIPVGGKIIPKRAPPSSSKEFVYQKVPDTVNPEMRNAAQIQAEVTLGASAKSVGGTSEAKGKVRVGSRVINKLPVALGRVLAGADYGGLSYSERLAAHRAATDGSLLQLANIFADKTGSSKFSSVDAVVSKFKKDVATSLRQLSGQ